MALERVLVIYPDNRKQPDFLRECAADGHAVHAVCGLVEARKQLQQNTYEVIVFDIDDECPGEVMKSIASIQPRQHAPLVVQGSPLMLAQMLAEFSQTGAEKAAPWAADALVIKCADATELRYTLKDLLEQRRRA